MKKMFILRMLPQRVIFSLIIPPLISALTFLSLGEAFAATKLLDWNFDDTTEMDSQCGDVQDCDGTSSAIYSTDSNPQPIRTENPSPQGGKHIRGRVYAFTDDPIYSDKTQPMLSFTSSPEWNSDEFYIKFYMMLESDLNDTGYGSEINSIKMFRVNCGSFNSNCPYTINMYPTQWHIYHTNASGTWSPSDAHNGWQFDEWHNYEFYTKYNSPGQSNGILRIWVDGVLQWERTDLNFISSTSEYIDSIGLIYHIKTFDSPAWYAAGDKNVLDGHVRIDAVEVWEGMPIPPNPPTNLRIVE